MGIVGWKIYLVWLGVMSIITFTLYGYDKAQAMRGKWRVRENILHWLALAGGFPGGWAGRSVFHHKTRKGSFMVVLTVSTVLHLGIMSWLLLK